MGIFEETIQVQKRSKWVFRFCRFFSFNMMYGSK
ncbi:hypothetical protein VPHD63_0052 [Vibrio phage D63]